MNRLILRFSLGTLGAFLTVILLWTGFVYWRLNLSSEETWNSPSTQLLLPMLETGAKLALQRDGVPLERFAQGIARILEQPVRLQPIDSPNIFEQHRELLRDGKPATRLTPGIGNTYYVPVGDGQRALIIGPIESKLLLNPPQLIAFILSITLIIALTGYILARPMIRMMNSMAATARQVMEGDLSARITGQRFGDRECAELVATFNRLADHNQTLFEKQQHLFQAIAHEMRTPTARMRFKLEMLATAQNEAKKERLFQELDADLDELDSFVKELVVYNSLDDGSALNKSAVPVASTLKREREALIHLIGELTVELLDCGDLSILAEERLFARVVRNLVSNALRYTKSRVVVSCEPKGDFVLIHVDDDGPGVPEKDRIRIFEPFKRLEESRTKASGGLGLGLAIVRRITQVHGATIDIDTSPLGGARFTLCWPRADGRSF